MPKPERYLTYRIDVLSTGAVSMANRVYEARCGLTVRELRILRLVDDRPGITFSELAGETKLERSLTSRLLNGLIKDGIIERENEVTDARVFHLRTTAKGRKKRNDAAKVGEYLEDQLLKPLSEEQRESLIEMVETLTKWVYGDFAEALIP